MLKNMERYRSGHNGADSKSVCEKSHGGSNPPLSATNGKSTKYGGFFVCDGEFNGIRTQ